VLERRYATWITTADIDRLAAAGVRILRIPTTYAAWVKVPGSQLYTGNQKSFLKSISSYAIARHGMHIVLDIHSLPGGVNGMPFGEAEGHFGWFNNQTALQYSYQAVEAAVKWIQNESGNPASFTFEPINEPVDNRNLALFGTPLALSDSGAAWVLQYIRGVITRVRAINPAIPVMFQGSFRPVSYWSPSFDASTNLVFDVHNYYFAGRPTDSNNLTTYICSDAKASAGDGKFPTWVGEWSIEAASNNLFANRAKNLNTGLYAFDKYTHGSAYWTAKFSGTAPVAGQGVQADYWNYSGFIQLGIINPSSGAAYCS
jgi:aryl-phospho-beta-D-glucosidase BglC (GH1 family)